MNRGANEFLGIQEVSAEEDSANFDLPLAGFQGSIVELHEAPQTSAFSALGSFGSEQLAFGFPLPAGTR